MTHFWRQAVLKSLEEEGDICRISGKIISIELTIDLKLIPPLDRPFRL